MKTIALILPLAIALALPLKAETNRSTLARNTILGAVAGTIIGHQSGNDLEGALIGAGAGALITTLSDHDRNGRRTNCENTVIVRTVPNHRAYCPPAVVVVRPVPAYRSVTVCKPHNSHSHAIAYRASAHAYHCNSRCDARHGRHDKHCAAYRHERSKNQNRYERR